jgi:hypothetical protein
MTAEFRPSSSTAKNSSSSSLRGTAAIAAADERRADTQKSGKHPWRGPTDVSAARVLARVFANFEGRVEHGDVFFRNPTS